MLAGCEYNYDYVDGVHVFEDLNGKVSLTNGIDNVLHQLEIQPGELIVYRDSMGLYDGVELLDSGNIEFILLNNCHNKKAAIKEIKSAYNKR